ncbi:MAG: hypothetical protein AAB879_01865 [Patescibacteria group bacterium]
MTLPHLLTASFWFSQIPPPFVPFFDRGILVISAAFAAAGLLAYLLPVRSRISDRFTREVVMAAANTLLWMGCVGLILYGFAFERVPYLSMRLFWIPLVMWFVWRVWKHWKMLAIEIPRIHRERAEREKFEKWLPKRKR